MDREELKNRTKEFGLRCLKLAAALPNNVIGRAIRGQLARCGPSVGSNYRAACRARSRAESVAKLGVVEEEAYESAYWMEMILDSRLMSQRRVAALHQEAEELTAIMSSSRITASARRS